MQMEKQRTHQPTKLLTKRRTIYTGKAIGATPGEYKEFLYEPNVSLNSNGSLHFTKITKDAQGHFLCEAKNTIGAGVSKVIFLKVNGKNSVNFSISIFIFFFKGNSVYISLCRIFFFLF